MTTLSNSVHLIGRLGQDPKFFEFEGGKMKATFITKVFEKGGNFSIDQFSMPFFPYSSYVGINVPALEDNKNMLFTDTSHTVEVVTVDTEVDAWLTS